MSQRPEFWIDVGGTFTDCLMHRAGGKLAAFKVLSSGVTKGLLTEIVSPSEFRDRGRCGDPEQFWCGYELRVLSHEGAVRQAERVDSFDRETGTFRLSRPFATSPAAGTRYELCSGEEAPILAIRTALGLRLNEPIPDVAVRLGTTRGTNALLTRRGAQVGFVTTAGFRDILRIGNQDRPRLFDLAIRKPEPLFCSVAEIDERLAADGSVLQSPSVEHIREQLEALRRGGCESLAICLLHAFANPVHELLVEEVARSVGFTEISRSSNLAPLIKIVSRGDTTVLDAYLNPILRGYVARLATSLGAGRTTRAIDLKLMTSAGGLVRAERFTGKDSILSGPAGGVIGYSRVAQRAGFARSIGFDMGGTSTDVSRFDGRYERELETTKAGVRIVSPMLAIETVAAGGGSVCGFDGVKLFVGPQSAGAEPGPACYGRGGPLTVTDVNVFLGKIIPQQFPFPLDRAAIQDRLAELCAQVAASPLGKIYLPVELALGFVEIANTTMSRAIRKISVARGYDPADYALVTFGGAGAQHACALARSLGMSQILSHPCAGVLSAYGMGLADVRRLKERSVLVALTPTDLANLEPALRELEEMARAEVAAEGIEPDQVEPPIRSLELRYRGIEGTIRVEVPSELDACHPGAAAILADAYHQRHRVLYGYIRENRPLEVVALQVEVVGRFPDPEETPQPCVARDPEPSDWVETWFEPARPHRTAVFLRSDLRPGDRFAGPAIVCEPTSTVVVDPGFTARILERGEILLEYSSVSPVNVAEMSAAGSGQADPVRLEVFNHLFASIAEQMGIALQQTSLSTNVKERLDFSCGIFSASGDLVVNAPHIPVHLGAMSETVRRILQDNPRLKSGDVFVTNDPYRGGSHLPDVTVVTPVHDESTGELLFLTASRAHHAEIGGIVPGSMPPFSRSLADEGVLIRNFLLLEGQPSRSHEAELRTLLTSGPYPSRAVEDNLADLSAQVAANQAGARQLTDLVARYTWPVVRSFMSQIQAAAAAKMRRALRRMAEQADGGRRVSKRTDHLDDGSVIHVTLTIADEKATIDFTGTGPVLATNLNANRAIVSAAVLYCFRCLIPEEIPLNSGVLEPVTIILPECLLNPPVHDDPVHCAAIVGGNVETSQRVVDVLLGALGVAAASQGTMNNLTFGDGTFGYYETICGGSGATVDSAGADAVHTHMTNTRLTDPEVIERRYPVRIREFSIRTGSGGRGLRRGGDGIVRRIEFLRPLRVSLLTERRGPYPPFGLEGGKPGALGVNLLSRSGATPQDVGGKASFDVAPGDVLTIQTPGGGAWGTVEKAAD